MHTYIALFRGINVGGKRNLPMGDLVAILEAAQLEYIRTCIQSGNVVFQCRRKLGKGKKDELARHSLRVPTCYEHTNLGPGRSRR